MAAVKKGGQNFSLAPVGAGSGPFAVRRVEAQRPPDAEEEPRLLEAGTPLPGRHHLPRDPGRQRHPRGAQDRRHRHRAHDRRQRTSPASRPTPSFIYKDTPAIGFNGFELNTGAPPFNDAAKRQAVALAIDKYADPEEHPLQHRGGRLRADPALELGLRLEREDLRPRRRRPRPRRPRPVSPSPTRRPPTRSTSSWLQLIQSQLAAAGITMNDPD